LVNGVKTPKVVGIDWEKLRQSDSSVIISEFTFDPESGHLTRFKRDDALNAAAQLWDMWGMKAPTKVSSDLTIQKSGPTDWTREELIAVLNTAGDAARGAGK
jgi:hypothetical protein